MRRLWAYILLAFTSLVLVGVSFSPLLKKSVSNIDYQSGREIVFHVENKDEGEELTKETIEDVANTMKERLANQNVTRYEINIQGNDTIALVLSEEYEQKYQNIIQYMEFDGSFALSNSAGTFALADDFLDTNSKAALETYNNYPCITLPVITDNEQYKAVLEGAKGEGAKPETSGESDEEAVSTYYLYLWYGFEEKMITPDTDYASNKNIIMKFKVEDDAAQQYFPDTTNKLFSAVNLDTDGDGVASQNEKKVAFDTANYYVNLLNASKLDVTIKHVGNNYVAPWVEPIINLGNIATVAISPTFIAMICAIILVSVLLVYFFRLGSISMIVTTLATLLAGLASMIFLSAEFTTISVFAFIALAIASLASGIIYLNKVKDEAYRGRSLKKANSEGARKALLPIIDVNAVLIIIGAFTYILGGAAMRTFAAITVLGGIASLILNALVLRGFMWLATNATCVQGKYNLFGIEGDKVPDLINEEKQTYFGPYAEKDLTKNKLKVGIGGGVILLATTVAMIVFGAINGSIYANKVNSYNDRIYFETTMSESSRISDENLRSILGKTIVFEDTNGNGKWDEGETKGSLTSKYGIASVDTGSKSYTMTRNEEDVTYYVSIVTLNGKIDEKLLAYYESDNPVVENSVEDAITVAIEDDKTDIENIATISVKKINNYVTGQPDVLSIAMSTLLGVGVAGVYLILRYRLSRGVVATLLAIASGAIAVGLLSLIHLPVIGGYVVAIAPVAVLFSLILSIMFMNKERELILEDKNKDNSLEHRKELSIKATSLSYVSVTTFAIVAIFVAINFFGFGSASLALNFIALILAMLIVLVVSPIVIAPLSNLVYGWLQSLNIKKPTKKKKAKARKINKSAEPEEAIFIGIND